MNTKVIFLFLLLINSLINFNISQVLATSGDSRENALNLPFNTIVSSSVLPSSSVWYNVTLSTSGDYSFNLSTNPGYKLNFYIFDSKGKIVGNSSSGIVFQVIALPLNAGIYSIQIEASFGSGSFTVSASYAEEGQLFTNPLILPLNTTLKGNFLYSTYYQISILENGYYEFNLSSDPSSLYNMKLLDSLGNFLKSPTSSVYLEHFVVNLTSGTYYVQIIFNSGNSPFYLTAIPYSIQPGEDFNHSINLSINTIYAGTIPITVYFRVNITNQGYYNFIIQTVSGDSLTLSLMDSSQQFIAYSHLANNLVEFLTGGIYYIKIGFDNPTGLFNVSYTNYIPHSGEYLSLAIFLPINTIVGGSTNFSHYFNFTINSPGTFKFSTNYDNYSIHLNFVIYQYVNNSYSNWIDFSSNSPASDIIYLRQGSYFIMIDPYYGSGNFNISYNIYYPLAGEILQTAINLPISTCISGNPSQRFFNFTSDSNDLFYFQLFHGLGFIIYNSYGRAVGSSNIYSNTITKVSINVTLSTGSYSIKIFSLTNFALSYQSVSSLSNNPNDCLISFTSSLTTEIPTSTVKVSNFISLTFSPFKIILASFLSVFFINKFKRIRNQ